MKNRMIGYKSRSSTSPLKLPTPYTGVQPYITPYEHPTLPPPHKSTASLELPKNSQLPVPLLVINNEELYNISLDKNASGVCIVPNVPLVPVAANSFCVAPSLTPLYIVPAFWHANTVPHQLFINTR
eukprot:TRINITY_DN6104_c0_g1_i2.p2 TRINITY_DN6104_c0_g1~~TRINITY_DN6104_c0_g1_i2.p2  ORF type:complete len:127 (-),score=7.29 TRINITY_DN6104_c0_g1_i2:140-520(-)